MCGTGVGRVSKFMHDSVINLFGKSCRYVNMRDLKTGCKLGLLDREGEGPCDIKFGDCGAVVVRW